MEQKPIEELEREILDCRRAINKKQEEIDQRVKVPEMKKLIGRFFKYRNCYSCPKPDEYWWLYSRITAYEDGGLLADEFQTDKDGRIDIKFNIWKPYLGLESRGGYIEITKAEYLKAKKRLQDQIRGWK